MNRPLTVDEMAHLVVQSNLKDHRTIEEIIEIFNPSPVTIHLYPFYSREQYIECFQRYILKRGRQGNICYGSTTTLQGEEMIGVFATKLIPNGHIVKFCSAVLTEIPQEMASLFSPYTGLSVFQQRRISKTISGPIGFINHACSQHINCEPYDRSQNPSTYYKICLANKDISRGEQLFYHYGPGCILPCFICGEIDPN